MARKTAFILRLSQPILPKIRHHIAEKPDSSRPGAEGKPYGFLLVFLGGGWAVVVGFLKKYGPD